MVPAVRPAEAEFSNESINAFAMTALSMTAARFVPAWQSQVRSNNDFRAKFIVSFIIYYPFDSIIDANVWDRKLPHH
jgi:hypothetical protein